MICKILPVLYFPGSSCIKNNSAIMHVQPWMFELNLGEGQIPNISLYINDKSYCHEPMFSIPIEYSGSHSDTWDTVKSKHTFQVKRLTKMVWVEQRYNEDIVWLCHICLWLEKHVDNSWDELHLDHRCTADWELEDDLIDMFSIQWHSYLLCNTFFHTEKSKYLSI